MSRDFSRGTKRPYASKEKEAARRLVAGLRGGLRKRAMKKAAAQRPMQIKRATGETGDAMNNTMNSGTGELSSGMPLGGLSASLPQTTTQEFTGTPQAGLNFMRQG